MRNSVESLRDSKLRSVFKGLTWRILATLTTIVIAYAITGKVSDALHIGGIEFGAKFLIYYLHERAWARVPLGTIRTLVGSGNLKGASVIEDSD